MLARQRFLILPWKYADQAEPFSVQQIQSTWQQVAALWSRFSYGLCTIEYTVLPWLTVSVASTSGIDPWPEMEAYMRRLVPDYDTYKQFARIKPGMLAGTTATPINSDGTMSSTLQMQGSYGIDVGKTAHEVGHALMEYGVQQGLGHSGAASGSGGIYTTTAYGEVDIMGRTYTQASPALAHRRYAGWVEETPVIASGTFTLNQMDAASGVRCLTVPATVTLDAQQHAGHIVIDYRAGAGVGVRFAPIREPFKGILQFHDTYLIKLVPVGQSWSDTGLGLSIAVDSGDASSAVVRVGIGEIVPPPPPPPPPPADTTPPQITVTSLSKIPIKGSFNVTVYAADDSGISSIQLDVDGIMKGRGTTSPLTVSVNANKLSFGTHTFTAFASDRVGNIASKTITLVK